MDIGNLDHTLVSSMMEDATEAGQKRPIEQIGGGVTTDYDTSKRAREGDASIIGMGGEESVEPLADGYRTQPWPHEEDERLLQAAATFKLPDNMVDWGQVSRHIGNRSAKQCNIRYNTLLKYRGESSRVGGWTAEEDARLTAAVRRNERKGGGIYWTKVCEEMGGERTHTQCLKRWRQTLQHIGSGARIGAWGEQEDALLLEAMSLYEGQGKGGGIDWAKVSAHLGGVRAPTQCYKRWHDAIKQRRKHLLKGSQWSDEEMGKLHEGVQMFAGDGLGGGVEWNDVAAHVGTRNAKECCTQWNRFCRNGSKDFCGRGPRIRTDPWDEIEERALYMGMEACRKSAAEEHGENSELVDVNWDKISAEFLNHIRTPKQCAKKWEAIVRNKMREDMKLASDLEQYQEPTSSKVRERGLKSGIWTAADDERLMEAVALFEGQGRGGATDWGHVCEYVGNGRTYDQCRIRYNGVVKILKQKGACVKTGSWEPAEDERLLAAVSQHKGQGRGGGIHWTRVSEHFNGERTPNQCHSHYSSILKPRESGSASSNTPWTDMDDIKLCEAVVLYQSQGKGGSVNWVMVQQHVGGDRSTYQLRMRWHSTLKNRVTQPAEGEKRKSLAPPPWSDDEVERLVATVEACRLPPAPGETAESVTEAAVGGKLVAHLIDWNTVSNAMTDASLPGFNTEKRTPLQCLHRWREAINEMMTDSGVNLMDSGEFNNTPWTEEEDIKFIEAVAVYNGHGRGGGIDWGKVCEYLGGSRKYNQCRHRWHNVLKTRAMREDVTTAAPMEYRREAMTWNTPTGSRITMQQQAPVPPVVMANAPPQPQQVQPTVVEEPTQHTSIDDAYANIQKYDI